MRKDFQCVECKNHFSAEATAIYDSPPCPYCGSTHIRRLISPPENDWKEGVSND